MLYWRIHAGATGALWAWNAWRCVAPGARATQTLQVQEPAHNPLHSCAKRPDQHLGLAASPADPHHPTTPTTKHACTSHTRTYGRHGLEDLRGCVGVGV